MSESEEAVVIVPLPEPISFINVYILNCSIEFLCDVKNVMSSYISHLAKSLRLMRQLLILLILCVWRCNDTFPLGVDHRCSMVT